jgi:D-glycero-alpha-D-manno-heptose-7-phosphate kinase
MQFVEAKVPYRIPLVGGITDYPAYYRKHATQSICCTIDRYLAVSVKQNSQCGLRIESKAELPWGMGLGSSGAYFSALVLAIARSKGKKLPKLVAARLAYELETGIDKCATGRQDSVACLFKGISKISYHRDDSVTVDRVPIPAGWREKLARRLLLFDTGVRRSARDSIRDILGARNTPLLNEIARLPGVLIEAWNSRDFDFLGTALDLQEKYRSRLSPTCRSRRTDRLLRIARDCGAGARLTGAGVGCLLCYCPEGKQRQLREQLGLSEIRFSILW